MDLPHKQSCWKHVSKIKQGLLPYKPSHQGWFWPCAVPYISNSVLPFGWDQNKASHPLNKHYCGACYSGKRVKSAWLFLPTPCVTVVRPARAANYCHLKDWVSTAPDEGACCHGFVHLLFFCHVTCKHSIKVVKSAHAKINQILQHSWLLK